MKKILTILLIFLMNLQAYALEDCLVSTNGKLTDISIEDNTVIDVYPLVTVMNEKNTLVVHPLKQGKTRFCILKNGKEKIMFNVNVNEIETEIEDVKGFDILSLDTPPGVYDFALDIPPKLQTIESKPPRLRGED